MSKNDKRCLFVLAAQLDEKLKKVMAEHKVSTLCKGSQIIVDSISADSSGGANTSQQQTKGVIPSPISKTAMSR